MKRCIPYENQTRQTRIQRDYRRAQDLILMRTPALSSPRGHVLPHPRARGAYHLRLEMLDPRRPAIPHGIDDLFRHDWPREISAQPTRETWLFYSL